MYSILLLLIFLGLLSIYYLNIYFEKKHSYWKDLEIDTPKYYYFVGNILDQFLNRRNIGKIITDTYNEFKGYNYFGFYNSTKPIIIIRNSAIIETILVKEFSSFHDNEFGVDENNPLTVKDPFLLDGDEWKTARGQIAPCHTTNKTKQLLPILHETSKKLHDYLKTSSLIAVDAKDLMMRITTENVGCCVFGVEAKSFQEQNSSELTFYSAIQSLLNPPSGNMIQNIFCFVFPFLERIFRRENKTQEITLFLKTIVQDTVNNRGENQIIRNDFLDILQQRKEKINNEDLFNMADILCHAYGFITDGVNTNSIVLQHFVYELGRNQRVQDKLRDEISEIKKNMPRNQELSYEMIQEMVYLEAIFNEVLRLHPPFPMFLKRVTRPFTLGPMREDNSGPSLTLPKGMTVVLPILGIHTDSRYHESPDDFKPERFLEDNVDVPKCTFLPFGEGPRKCLGMKFGALQTKLVIISLVENYEIRVNCKTKEPVESDPGTILNLPKDGYWIDLIKLETA